MPRLVDIRPEERRTTWAAFFSLLGITAGHTLLETARDALFLAKLPASRLPWVYLAMAAVGLLAARVNRRRPARAPVRGAMSIALLVAAAITVGFWSARSLRGAPFVYILYLWTGIFTAWVVGQLWAFLGNTFTVVQAKRLYGFVGAGSLLGAVGGAATARALAAVLPAQHLLLGAAAMLVLTAVGPAFWLSVRGAEAEAPRGPAPGRPHAQAKAKALSLADDLRLVSGDPYIKRILLLVLCSTVTVTIVDYLFKSIVADQIPAAELGAFFASVSFVLSSLALAVQLLAVGWVFRSLGVHRAGLIMPSLLLVGAVGVLVAVSALGAISVAALCAAVLLKGADGSLRHSLQRTSTELLYVPIPDAKRGRAKAFIELVGQRGGQAVASVSILALVALLEALRWPAGRGYLILGASIAGLATAWVVIAAGVRRHYLDLFRATLREGRLDYTIDLPQLDLNALESLFAALSSSKDAEVLGALDLLAAQHRERLIPALILYHPSSAIVLRALDLFVREGRRDFMPIAERLLGHADPEVRAAALRARAAVMPEDEAFVRARLNNECLEVRATALVSLLARERMVGDEADRALWALVRDASPAVRIALARAIGQQPSERCEAALLVLVEEPEVEVQMEAAWAMGKMPGERFLPWLLDLLAFRMQGSAARDALAEHGLPALAFLDRTLTDPATTQDIRWRIPRAMGRFAPEHAAPILLRHLRDQRADGMLRFRILRALGGLRTLQPDLPLDGDTLAQVSEEFVRKALELLSWRVLVQRGPNGVSPRRTPAFDLMVTLLRDKETHAMARLFRVLALQFPSENFERIQRGLRSKNPKARASSRELLENLVAPPLRQAVLALVDELPDAERLARAPQTLAPGPVPYDRLLSSFVARDDELGILARYHAADTGTIGAARGTLVAELLARAPTKVTDAS